MIFKTLVSIFLFTQLIIQIAWADSFWLQKEPFTSELYSVESPMSNVLLAVDAISPNFAMAVGFNEAVVHWDGKNWQNFISPSSDINSTKNKKVIRPGIRLVDIDIVSVNNIWIIASGHIFYWNGQHWASQKINLPKGDNLTLSAISMMSEHEGYAVGKYSYEDVEDINYRRGIIFSYNKGVWSTVKMPILKANINSYLANVYVEKGRGWIAGPYTIFKYIDGKWHYINKNNPKYLGWPNDLGIISSSEFWFTISQGALYKFKNGKIRRSEDMPGYHPFDNIEVINSDDIWLSQKIISESLTYVTGELIHYDGKEWHTVLNEIGLGINDMKFISSGEGWIVGDGGMILQYKRIYE